MNSTLSEQIKKVYEAMPIPFCLLHAYADTYDLLAVSNGLCGLLKKKREDLMDPARSLLHLVASDERQTVINSLEYSRVQPGTASHVAYHFVDDHLDLNVNSCSIAEEQKDGSYLIYIYFSACMMPQGYPDHVSKEAGDAVQKMHLPETKTEQNMICEWQIDLHDSRTIAYHRQQPRAIELDPQMPYDKAVQAAVKTLHSTEDQKKLAALLDRQFLLKSYQEGHTSFNLEYRRDEDGKMPFWISTSIQTYLSPVNGHVEGRISSYDITEKILEKQLISRFTMLGYDVVGILGVPSRMVRFFRLKPMQFGMVYEHYQDYLTSIDGDVDRVVAPDQRKAVSQALRLETVLDALKEDSSYEYSFEVTTSDGRHRHKLLQFSYLDEKHDTIFLCRSDVTGQYQREHEQIKELRAAKLAAEQANEAKSTFLASVSHDLRTPLNGVIGFTELALHEKDEERKQTYMQKVKSSSTLLLDLVNDTLELSRIESGKSIYAPEAVSLREMSEAVLTSLQPSAEIKSLSFAADLQECPDVTVWTDRLKFQKIFLNLLSNAIKYTPSGGSVQAAVRWHKKDAQGNTCHITVKDNGIGIRPEFLPHIFESFSQDSRPETANIQGTGLGLAIVHRMVEQLHGTITVHSRLNVGTEFQVALPMEEADAAQQKTVQNVNNVSLQGRTVLLCEDNPLNIEIAKAMLSHMGVNVETASNGREGVETFAKSRLWHYDAVFMDIRMPVMDGIDAAKAIRSLEREDASAVAMIAMTADAFEEDVQHCYEAGMNDHITKPINPEHLNQVLAKWIYETDRIKQKNHS